MATNWESDALAEKVCKRQAQALAKAQEQRAAGLPTAAAITEIMAGLPQEELGIEVGK